MTESTRRYEPSLAVWTRAGRAQDLHADFNLQPDEVANYAAGTGHRAVEMCDAFVTSRMSNIEALAFSDSGELLGLRPMQLPWTVWLREEDLERRFWDVIGTGPRLDWVTDERRGL